MEKAQSNDEAQHQERERTLQDGKTRFLGRETGPVRFQASREHIHRATRSFVASFALFLTTLILCIAWNNPSWKQHLFHDIYAFCGFGSSGEMLSSDFTPLTGNVSRKR